MHPTQKAASVIFLSPFLSLCFEKDKDQNVRNVVDYGDFEIKKNDSPHSLWKDRGRERERERRTGTHRQSDQKTD